MLSDNQVNKLYPVGTVVRLRRTNEFCLIRKVFFLKNEQNFLHYLGIIEDRGNDLWALYPADIELECLPSTTEPF